MSESHPAIPPGTKTYYRSADGEAWTELDGVVGVDVAETGGDRTVLSTMVVDGTMTFAGKYDPEAHAALVEKLRFAGERSAVPSQITKARSLLEGKPVPKGKPAIAKHVAGRNDRCPCGSGRKYKRCHLGHSMASVMVPTASIAPAPPATP